MRMWIVGFTLLTISLGFPESVDACPNCKDGLHSDYVAVAYGISILLMMAMPFSLLAVWTVILIKSNRRDGSQARDLSMSTNQMGYSLTD